MKIQNFVHTQLNTNREPARERTHQHQHQHENENENENEIQNACT